MYTDAKVAEAAQVVNARAYTVGWDVWGEAGSSSRVPRSSANSEPNNKQSNIIDYSKYISERVMHIQHDGRNDVQN